MFQLCKSDRDFHRWSIDKFEDYWETVWNYFDIVASRSYKKVFFKTGPGILDNDWFMGAKFNYAENLTRYRDDTTALIYEDEEGSTDSVSFAEMFEEVKRYAAAFRIHGIEKGDRVACHMSNRKEAIFAMLATLSIGAIWGGSIPYFGALAAANIVSRMEPKILIAVDRFQDNGVEFDVLSCLPTIAQNSTTLEKIIIVPSRSSTLSKNISNIKNR
nr:acetoacetyl-CoA synthetase-like isoform X2 [Parasteatoda tepidariorum]